MLTKKIKEVLKYTPFYKMYYKLKYKEFKFRYPKIMSKEEVNSYLYNKIMQDKPFMACRLGSAELKVVKRYLNNKPFEKSLLYSISNNAGFFPPTEQNLVKLAELYLRYLENTDFLAIWFNKGELGLIKKYRIQNLGLLGDYSLPFLSNNPWTKALRGKKVLIIHPFEKSIKKQFERREFIFKNKEVLPEFELITLKAVQSIGGYHPYFKDWFDALNYMKDKIATTDFDVAIIGAGAYGLPLAGFCKEIGKKGIHLGGATQLLFGIMGKRWEDDKNILSITTPYWVRPLDEEKPSAFKSVEDGCYW